jgi:hypothetical protein
MSIEARNIDLALHKTGSSSDDAYTATLASTVALELDEVDAVTLTVKPALTLPFTFMTHSPRRVSVQDQKQ